MWGSWLRKARRRVDLPAPLGPTTAVSVPAARERDMDLRTGVRGAYPPLKSERAAIMTGDVSI